MFYNIDHGSPRIIKNKSDLMNNLIVMVLTRGNKLDVATSEFTSQFTSQFTSILDGCAILWKIKWPSANGTVYD